VTSVVVLGATGEMGSRVCRLLRRWVPGVVLMGANRSGTGHPEFPVRRVDVRDRASLLPVLRGADLVINAVGPYTWDPGPLVAACVEARCHYTDLAEDLGFLARLEREARARDAARAGVGLVPGASTLPGLVQVLASRWSARADVGAVTAWLSMGSRNPVSLGLLVGMLRPLGRRAPGGGRWFTRLARVTTLDGRRLLAGAYPAPFPARGIRVGARRVPVRFRMGFDRALWNRGLALAARGLGRLPVRAVDRLARVLLPLVAAVRPLGTPYGVLVVAAEDGAGRELDRVEVRARAAGLDVPALPAVWVARRLAEDRGLPGGVLGLDRVVSPERAAAWLREAGYEVVSRGDVG
jgi:hypothetical protein